MGGCGSGAVGGLDDANFLDLLDARERMRDQEDGASDMTTDASRDMSINDDINMSLPDGNEEMSVDDGGGDMSDAYVDMSLSPDDAGVDMAVDANGDGILDASADTTPPPDLIPPSIAIAGRDLWICGYQDQQRMTPVNNFANVLATATKPDGGTLSYYISVDPQSQSIDAGVRNHCVRLCHALRPPLNPPCGGQKCATELVPLGGDLTTTLDKVSGFLRNWGLYEGGTQLVAGIEFVANTVTGSDGGLEEKIRIQITVGGQMCCYYLLNTESCPP